MAQMDISDQVPHGWDSLVTQVVRGSSCFALISHHTDLFFLFERGKVEEIMQLLTCSPEAQTGLGQVKDRSPELQPRLQCGWQRPQHLTFIGCACISRVLLVVRIWAGFSFRDNICQVGGCPSSFPSKSLPQEPCGSCPKHHGGVWSPAAELVSGFVV